MGCYRSSSSFPAPSVRSTSREKLPARIKMTKNKLVPKVNGASDVGFVFHNARRPAANAPGNDPRIVFIRGEIANLNPPFNPPAFNEPEFVPLELLLTGFALQTNGQVLASEPIHKLVRQPEENFVPARSGVEVPPEREVLDSPSDAFYFYEEIITLMRGVLVWLDRNLTSTGKFAKKSRKKIHFLDTILPDVALLRKKLREEDGDLLATWYNDVLPIGTPVPSTDIADHYDRCCTLRNQAVGLLEITSVVTEAVLLKCFPGQFGRRRCSAHSLLDPDTLNMALYFIEGNVFHKDVLFDDDPEDDPEDDPLKFTDAEFFFLQSVLQDEVTWSIEGGLSVPRLTKALEKMFRPLGRLGRRTTTSLGV